MLFGLLQKDAGALRADFRKHYGMSLQESAHHDLFECADLAANLPRDGSSAVFRSVNPDWQWTLEAHMGAIAADGIRWLVWSKTKDASRKPPRNQPKPIPRPGIDQEAPKAQNRFEEVEGLPREEFMEWMDKAGIKRPV